MKKMVFTLALLLMSLSAAMAQQGKRIKLFTF